MIDPNTVADEELRQKLLREQERELRQVILNAHVERIRAGEAAGASVLARDARSAGPVRVWALAVTGLPMSALPPKADTLPVSFDQCRKMMTVHLRAVVQLICRPGLHRPISQLWATLDPERRRHRKDGASIDPSPWWQ